jgi:hypothetical protein
MRDLTLEAELNEALQVDIHTNPTNEGLPPSSCAERFYDSHSALMERLKRPWLITRLTNMIKNGMRQGWSKFEVEKQQLNLPGFETLPRRIFLSNGTRKLLDTVTIGEIRQHIKMLRHRFRNDPKIKQMEAVLALMGKYTSTKPRITWREVKQREVESLGH